ncbi:hypothetical protein KKG31_03080 [Patescibacteria group bacterium]|nr:hypothetical protein [Patescibacteria group bacterium]MBU1758144.1 hypothetical protein [Patescibacteria group bacterium]
MYPLTAVQLANGLPLSVAVTHVLLSSNVIVMPVVYVDPFVNPEYVGGVLSIRVTVAVASPVFPALSSNSNVNVPLFTNVRHVSPPKLVTVIASFSPVSVANTFPLVHHPPESGS